MKCRLWLVLMLASLSACSAALISGTPASLILTRAEAVRAAVDDTDYQVGWDGALLTRADMASPQAPRPARQETVGGEVPARTQPLEVSRTLPSAPPQPVHVEDREPAVLAGR